MELETDADMSPAQRDGSRGARNRGRRQDILDVFARRVAAVGYDQTNISDIANELNISKGTVFHHFGSKITMLEEQHTRYMTRRINELRSIFPQLESSFERITAVVYSLVLCHTEDRDSTRMFTREFMRLREDESITSVRKLRQRYTSLVVDEFRRGISSGEFRRTDPMMASLQVIGACNWAWTWLEPDGPYSAAEVAALFAETFVRGFAADGEFSSERFGAGGPIAALVIETMRAPESAFVGNW